MLLFFSYLLEYEKFRKMYGNAVTVKTSGNLPVFRLYLII